MLAEFKAGRSPIMLATDVASRGLGMCPRLFPRGGIWSLGFWQSLASRVISFGLGDVWASGSLLTE